MDSVSVAMPVRNAETTIAEAVGSILGQSREEFDFVVVDHGSTDATPQILKRLAQEDSRLRVIRHEGSFVEAANFAWRETRGEFVARMDADDFAYPERLEKQVAFLRAHPDCAACGTRVRIAKRGERGKAIPPDGGFARYGKWLDSVVSPEDIAAQRFVESPVPNPSAMIRRSVLEDLGGYRDTSWAEDYDFWLRLLDGGLRVGKVDEVLLDWFDSPGRITRTDGRYDLELARQAKAVFLGRIPLVRKRGVAICGAGPVGKSLVRHLGEKGVRVVAWCEVNERQIGNRIAGIPVLGPEAVSDLRGSVVLIGAVGQPGARSRIRRLATGAGYTEGEDFFCAA